MIDIERLLIKKENKKFDIVSYDKLFEYLNEDITNVAKREITYALLNAKVNRELANALRNSSKSSEKLAKIGNFIGWVGLLATVIGTIFGILSFFCN